MTADQELAFLRSQLGVQGGSLADLRMQFYGGTGSQNERASAFWRAGGATGGTLAELEGAYLRAKTGKASGVSLDELRAAWWANPAVPPVVPPYTPPTYPGDITYVESFPGAAGAAAPSTWSRATTYPTGGSLLQTGSGGLKLTANSAVGWNSGTPGAASAFFGNPNAPQTTPKILSDGRYRFGYDLLNTGQQYATIGFRARSAELWNGGDGGNTPTTGYALVIAPLEKTIDVISCYNSTSVLPNGTPISVPALSSPNLEMVVLIKDRRLAFKVWTTASGAEPGGADSDASWLYDNPNLLFDESDGSFVFAVANGPIDEAKTVTIRNFRQVSEQPWLGVKQDAPTAAVSGFTLDFLEDFATDAAAGTGAGQFLNVYGQSYTPYTIGGTNRPDLIVSAHHHVFDLALPGNQAANGWFGKPATSTTYQGGRFSMRAKAVDAFGNGPAFMVWPSSDNWWEGELDFPESISYNGGLIGFQDAPWIHHHKMVQGQEAQAQDVALGVSWRDWHVYTLEWFPPGKGPTPATGSVTYYVDGVQVYTTTTDVPTTPHRFTLQVGDYGSAGHVYIDWIRIDKVA